MKSKKKYIKNDRVLVKSFAGPNVCVTLKKRYVAKQSELKLGVDGWEAQITHQREVEKLRKKVFLISEGKSRKFGYLILTSSKSVDR